MVRFFIAFFSSGRPEFLPKNRIDTERYLLEGLELWRQKMGIKKFHLCGHSLGGYVATKYAGKNRDKVLSLNLISPAGMWPVPPDVNEEFKGILSKSNFITSAILKEVKNYWIPNRSPFQLLRRLGLASALYLKTYVQSYPRLEKNERKDLMRYLFQILMNRGTGELAMSYILHPVFFYLQLKREHMGLIRW